MGQQFEKALLAVCLLCQQENQIIYPLHLVQRQRMDRNYKIIAAGHPGPILVQRLDMRFIRID